MPEHSAAEELRVTKAVARQAERNAELAACLGEIHAVLNRYAATFHVSRLVTVELDGQERTQMQISVVNQ